MNKPDNKVHDLLDFGLAKEIVSDLPKLREIFETTKQSLTPYKKYRDAANILDRIDNALIELDLHLEIYKRKLLNKGKVNE
jgi:hypothetical protein